MFKTFLVGGALLASALPGLANAASMNLFINDDGQDTHLTYSGAIDLTGAVFVELMAAPSASITPVLAIINASVVEGSWLYVFETPEMLLPVLGAGAGTVATSAEGAGFAIASGEDEIGIAVPENYVSGDDLEGKLFFEGKSLSDIGLVAGNYQAMFGDNTLTVSVTEVDAAVVPLPASLPLVLTGLAALGLGAARRKA